MGTPDLKAPVRAAMMKALKADTGVVALIPKASVYPGTVPASRTLPFSRFGSMIASPFRASGLDSSAFRVSIQGFSQGVKDGAGAITTTAEDHADAIGSAFKIALDGATLVLEGGMKARVTWIQTIAISDPSEASAWMVTSTFGVEVAG